MTKPIFYMACQFDEKSNQALKEYQQKIAEKLKGGDEHSDFHITLAHSKTEEKSFEELASVFKPRDNLNVKISPDDLHLSFFETGDTYAIILKVKSDYCTKRFEAIMRCGATYDYKNYVPHITILYDVPSCDIRELPRFKEEIKIVREIQENF